MARAFTDLPLFKEKTGEVFLAKTPSTPADPSVGLLDGKMADLASGATCRSDPLPLKAADPESVLPPWLKLLC